MFVFMSNRSFMISLACSSSILYTAVSIVVDTPRTAESDRSTFSKLIGHDCALWRTQARVRVVVSDYTVRKRVLSRLLTISIDTAGLTRSNMQLRYTSQSQSKITAYLSFQSVQ